jgi:hypothetical protein
VGDPAARGRYVKRALAGLLAILVTSAIRPDSKSGVGIFEHVLDGLGSMLGAAARILQEIADLINAAH